MQPHPGWTQYCSSAAHAAFSNVKFKERPKGKTSMKGTRCPSSALGRSLMSMAATSALSIASIFAVQNQWSSSSQAVLAICLLMTSAWCNAAGSAFNSGVISTALFCKSSQNQRSKPGVAVPSGNNGAE